MRRPLRGSLRRTLIGLAIALGSVSIVPPLQAVQLAGVTPPLPPGMDRKFELFFGNDFLGRGGEIDDFRTQQFGFVGSVAERWNLVVDHSILTFEDPTRGDPGRIDHLSVSAGYRLLVHAGQDHAQEIEVGGGFRVASEIGGARIQNGFHQLIGSRFATMPYVDTDRLDGTLWVRVPRHGIFKRDGRVPLLGGGWDFGYSVRASTLVTTDAQWDGSAGLSAVASRGWFQAWLGIQGDWRQGHDQDNVSRETASFEEGAGVVVGVRVGPLLLESLQQFNGKAAYGHLSLVSTGEAVGPLGSGDQTLGIQAGLSMPDVYANVQVRWSSCAALRCSSGWRRSVVLDYRFGKPQFGNDVEKYLATRQVSAALEIERAPFQQRDWLTAFGALGAGWRSEGLEGAGSLVDDPPSETVGRPGLVGDVGLRFSTSAVSSSVSLMLQLGLSGWLPASGDTVEFADVEERLQRPGIVMISGVLFRVFVGR